jgi:hypothetical protein
MRALCCLQHGFRCVKEWFAGAKDEFFNVSASPSNIVDNLGKVIYNTHSKIQARKLGEKKDEKTKDARTTIGAINGNSNDSPRIHDTS